MSRYYVQLCVHKESELPLVVELGYYNLKYLTQMKQMKSKKIFMSVSSVSHMYACAK